MIKDEVAEARLKKVAQAILAEEGIPTEDSDLSIFQTFMVLGLEEPRLREINLKVIFEDFGILGWLLSFVFRRKVRKLLERVSQEVGRAIRWHRDEQMGFWDESRLRQSLLEAATRERERASWEERDEGKAIRDRASRAASKTRDATVDQLRQFLKLARIRLLEQEIEIAGRAELEETARELQEALVEAFREALKELDDIDCLVDELAEFDALMESTRKLGQPKQRKRK